MLSAKDLHGVARDDAWGCRLLWVVGFATSLPVAFVARLTGWRWKPWAARADGYQSVLSEANSMANQIVALAYSAY